jgi:hypothetical protein
MRRIASFVVPGGLVVLAGWTFAAAWPPAVAPRDVTAAQATSPTPPSVVTQMDAEVAKLGERLDQPKPFTPAERDPFAYGAPPPRPRPVEPVAPPPPPTPPAPDLPHLVAITSKTTSAGVVRTAVFAASDGVMFAHPGDTIGALVVRSIGDGVVELADPVTGTRYSVR